MGNRWRAGPHRRRPWRFLPLEQAAVHQHPRATRQAQFMAGAGHAIDRAVVGNLKKAGMASPYAGQKPGRTHRNRLTINQNDREGQSGVGGSRAQRPTAMS